MEVGSGYTAREICDGHPADDIWSAVADLYMDFARRVRKASMLASITGEVAWGRPVVTKEKLTLEWPGG